MVCFGSFLAADARNKSMKTFAIISVFVFAMRNHVLGLARLSANKECPGYTINHVYGSEGMKTCGKVVGNQSMTKGEAGRPGKAGPQGPRGAAGEKVCVKWR